MYDPAFDGLQWYWVRGSQRPLNSFVSEHGNKHPEDVMGIGIQGRQRRIVMSKPREPIMDLDTLPWPTGGVEFETYLTAGSLPEPTALFVC